MRTYALSAVLLATLAVSGHAHAAATEWEEHSQGVLNAIRPRVIAQQGGNQVEVLAEFPTQDAPGHFLESTSSFLIPKSVSTQYDITELNNAGEYCGQFQALTDLTNTASVGITKAMLLGLDVTTQLAQAIVDSQLFKEKLDGDPSKPFAVVAQTNARVNGLNGEVKSLQAMTSTLAATIASRQSGAEYKALKDGYDALSNESKTGVPPTQEAQQLVKEVSSLTQQIEGLNQTIGTLQSLEPNAPSLKALQDSVKALQGNLEVKKQSLDQMVAPYRQGKKAESDQWKAEKLDPYEAETARSQGQLSSLNAQILNDQQAIATSYSDPSYISAKAKVEQMNEMIAAASDLQKKFSELRDGVIHDAILAVNYGRSTLNDWAAIDAAVASGTFPVWTNELVAIPQRVSWGGYSSNLATLYDLNVHADVTDILNEPVARLPMQADPTAGTAVVLPSLPDVNGKAYLPRNVVQITNPSDQSDEVFPLSAVSLLFGGVPVPLAQTHKKLGSGTPTIRMNVTLGTYCGNLRSHEEPGTDQVVQLSAYSVLVRPLRTIFEYQPRDLSQTMFPTALNGSYFIEEQFKPTRASCNLEIHDYDSYVRSWGKEENNYIFHSDSKSWDDTELYDRSNHTLKCNFEQATSEMSPEQQSEINGYNQMAINETLAQFIQANAKRPIVPARISEDTLKQYKDAFPRQTWAPTMMAICGGEPICDIAGVVLDSVGTAVQSSSTSVKRTNDVSLSMDVSRVYAAMVPHAFSTNVAFRLRR